MAILTQVSHVATAVLQSALRGLQQVARDSVWFLPAKSWMQTLGEQRFDP